MTIVWCLALLLEKNRMTTHSSFYMDFIFGKGKIKKKKEKKRNK